MAALVTSPHPAESVAPRGGRHFDPSRSRGELAGGGGQEGTRVMKTNLTMTADQHVELQKLLFPGDGLEAAALLLCGRRADGRRHRLLVHRVVGLEAGDYEVRDRDLVRWRTEFVVPLLGE